MSARRLYTAARRATRMGITVAKGAVYVIDRPHCSLDFSGTGWTFASERRDRMDYLAKLQQMRLEGRYAAARRLYRLRKGMGPAFPALIVIDIIAG